MKRLFRIPYAYLFEWLNKFQLFNFKAEEASHEGLLLAELPIAFRH